MDSKLKIDIVSDVVCPWCIIGYKRLEKAIAELGIQDRVEIKWQPFELNPKMSAEGENIDEHITRKYGTSKEANSRSKASLIKYGAELGFTFDYFDAMKIVNTRDAHILIDYARENGKQTELNLRLITAFFSERKDISDRDILMQEIKNVGLDMDIAKARLENKDAYERIVNDEAYWTGRGISSVPTMVFNEVSGLSGAQPVDVYKRVLTQLLNDQ